jgi:hypothetical protein
MTRRWLAAILAVSFALRIWLAAEGGQWFWQDESRYQSAESAAADLMHGRMRDAAADLFAHADHVLFRTVALPGALLAYAIGGPHPVLVSAYFALFSVGTIFMLWAVARRSGASESEALWAALLGASANSLFFYSRFYLPYDMAMFALMGALWLALGRCSRRNSFLTGAVAACGFLTYNGYWLLAAAILALYAVRGGGGRGGLLARGAWAAFGFAAVVSLVVALGATVSGGLVAEYGRFAASVRQGDFHIGYGVIAEYFWYTERGLLFVWLCAVVFALYRGGPQRLAGRMGWWVWGLAVVLGGLVALSDVVPRLMVYGRLAREVVPFACLAAARGLTLFLDGRRSRRVWSVALVLTVALLAAFNFAAPLAQSFPSDFFRMASREISRTTGSGYSFYRVLYAEGLWGRQLTYELPTHTDLLRRENPMRFRPYQYEGYSAAQRAQLNSVDVAMRLVRFDAQLAPRGQEWGGYPGPVRMSVTFHPENWMASEPIIVFGEKGAADVIFVRYLDSSHIAFGLDHWGSGLILSEPVAVDFGAPHSLLISAGPLLPHSGSALYGASPQLEGLRNRFVVIMDGRVIVSRRAEFNGSVPRDIFFGVNVVDASTVSANFTGEVSEFSQAPLAEVIRAVPSTEVLEIARRRPAEWEGALGPIHLRLRLPEPGVEVFTRQPLISIGGPGSSDALFVECAAGGEFRIGYDSRGRDLLWSNPLHRSGFGWEDMDVCIGAMLPAGGAPIFKRFPAFERMRGTIYVRVNGETALLAERPYEPADARGIALGENTVASSVCGSFFQGDMEPARAIGPENLPPFGTRLSDMLANPDSRWGGFTGPVRLRTTFPRGLPGRTEPLLVSGARGAMDAVSVRYEGDNGVRFVFEHSNGAVVTSAPVRNPAGLAHEILISTGALMPAQASGVYSDSPELLRLRTLVEVAVDGRPVLVTWQDPHPASAGQTLVGIDNAPDDGSIRSRFQGEIESLMIAQPADAFEQGRVGSRLARPGWDGYSGPLAMRLSAMDARPGPGRPIITSGYPGGGDFVFLDFDPSGMATIVQDHWGSPLVRSRPFQMSPGTEHTLIVSYGALFPPQESGLYRKIPDLLELRGRIVVLVDGRRVLSEVEPSHPSPSDRIILGANLIGGSSTGPVFNGIIADVEPAPIESVRP